MVHDTVNNGWFWPSSSYSPVTERPTAASCLWCSSAPRERDSNPVIASFHTNGSTPAHDVNSSRPPGTNMSAILRIKCRWSSGESRKMSPQARTASKRRSKNVESWTASQTTGVLGRLRRKASTNNGAASTAKTFSPSATRTSVIGNPGPQPRSITAAPQGSDRPHFLTAFTPMPVERPLPRQARNSAATPSYPFDRSIMDS